MPIYRNDFFSPASSLSVIFLTVPGVMRGAWTAWINAGDGLWSPGALTLFGGQRVLFFGLRLLQLCLVKISDFSHVGLVRHFACEGWNFKKIRKTTEHSDLPFSVCYELMCLAYIYFSSTLCSGFHGSIPQWEYQTDMKGVATVCPHMYVCEGCLPPPHSHASLIVSRMWMPLKCDYFNPSFLCLFIPFSVVGSLFSPSASSHTVSLSLFLCSHPCSLVDLVSTAVIFLT